MCHRVLLWATMNVKCESSKCEIETSPQEKYKVTKTKFIRIRKIKDVRDGCVFDFVIVSDIIILICR